MKKRASRLRLSRETIAWLEGQRLAVVRGGEDNSLRDTDCKCPLAVSRDLPCPPDNQQP